MEIICVITMLVGLGMIILPIFTKKESSRGILFFGSAVFILSLCMYGAFKYPKASYDLYRHYMLIETVSNENWNISYAVFTGIPQLNNNYASCFVFNSIIFIISKYLTEGVLPFLSASLYYGAFLYIFFHENKRKKTSNLAFLVSLLLCSICMPYLYIYSGIRNSMAVALAAVGIYRYFKVNHHFFSACIWIVAGALIHPFAGVTAIVIIMCKIKPRLIWGVCIVIFPILLEPIMEWCRLKSGNDFLSRIGAKYYNYTKVREDNQGLVYYFSAIIVSLTMCIRIFLYLFRKKNISNIIVYSQHEKIKQIYCLYDDEMLSGIWWYIILSLGFVQYSNIMLRFPFLLGCFAPVFINRLWGNSLIKCEFPIQKLALLLCIIGLSLLVLYENIAWLR